MSHFQEEVAEGGRALLTGSSQGSSRERGAQKNLCLGKQGYRAGLKGRVLIMS